MFLGHAANTNACFVESAITLLSGGNGIPLSEMKFAVFQMPNKGKEKSVVNGTISSRCWYQEVTLLSILKLAEASLRMVFMKSTLPRFV